MLTLLLLIFITLFVCLYVVDPHVGVRLANAVKGRSGDPERFLFHLFSMLGKLASIDQNVARSEVSYVSKLEVELTEETKRTVVQYFNEGKASKKGFEEFVDQFVSEFPLETELHSDFLDCLVGLAFADGVLRDSELQALQMAADTFRVPSGSFKVIFERHTRINEKKAAKKAEKMGSAPPPPTVNEAERWPYSVLGVKPTDSIPVIKARYRKLVFEYHPDSASLRGVAPEVRALSERRFRDLKEAYEAIRVKKSF